jgi:hypothetical protein
MSRRRSTVARERALRAIIALSAALACLGAVAYAANRPEGAGRGSVEADTGTSARREAPSKNAGARPPRPQLTTRTEAIDTRVNVRFKFSAAGEGLRFQCQLDRGAWKSCQSPHKVRGIVAGQHSFAVRALRRAQRGPAARFAWTKVDPQPLTVEPRPTGLAALHPGAPPQTIPVRVANPNAVPVRVTSLTIAVSADPPGCPANPNLELAPSSLSSTAPLVLAAGGELVLPTATIAAPTIALRELPFNQDACQGVSFPLRVDAEARG